MPSDLVPASSSSSFQSGCGSCSMMGGAKRRGRTTTKKSTTTKSRSRSRTTKPKTKSRGRSRSRSRTHRGGAAGDLDEVFSGKSLATTGPASIYGGAKRRSRSASKSRKPKRSASKSRRPKRSASKSRGRKRRGGCAGDRPCTRGGALLGASPFPFDSVTDSMPLTPPPAPAAPTGQKGGSIMKKATESFSKLFKRATKQAAKLMKSSKKTTKKKTTTKKTTKKTVKKTHRRRRHGGAASDFATVVSSAGPSNTPTSWLSNETMFRQFNKSGQYIPNEQLKYAAAPISTGKQPDQFGLKGFDKYDGFF